MKLLTDNIQNEILPLNKKSIEPIKTKKIHRIKK